MRCVNGEPVQFLQCNAPMSLSGMFLVEVDFVEGDDHFIVPLKLQFSASRGVFLDEERSHCPPTYGRQNSRDRNCHSFASCPNGYVMEEGVCVIHNENVIINVTIVSTIKAIDKQDNNIFFDFITELRYSRNLNALVQEMSREDAMHTHYSPSLNVFVTKTYPRITQVKVIVYADIYMQDETDHAKFINRFVNELMSLINTDLLSYIGESVSQIISLRTSSKGHDVTAWSIATDHCQWKNYDNRDVIIFNDRVEIVQLNQQYSHYKVHSRLPKIVVCVNTTTSAKQLLSSTDVTSMLLYYISITVFMISLSLLVLRIGWMIFLCRLSQVRSWPYMNNTKKQLAASIVVIHLVFLVTHFIDISHIHDACVILSAVRHGALLP